MKAIFKLIHLLPFVTILVTGCYKRNFFPDGDDPGLSRFTSRGYNVITAYINSTPYINPFSKTRGNDLPTFIKVVSSGASDTLNFSWRFVENDPAGISYQNEKAISISIPMPKSFSRDDFFALQGKRFDSETCRLSLSSNQPGSVSGTANIYFTSIAFTPPSPTGNNAILSGLFNGNIGDSILITKGRFDFAINTDKINF
ncbi:MAG TPA: hypothetical protein VLS85_13550 [Hanamia sp.]|nr:hypothetical protein [Hanamia sp.]